MFLNLSEPFHNFVNQDPKWPWAISIKNISQSEDVILNNARWYLRMHVYLNSSRPTYHNLVNQDLKLA